MRTKKPTPVFELVFTGGDIFPEKIPIGKVGDALSAVQRLAAGEILGDEGGEDDEEGDGSKTKDGIRLLDVARSSAIFRFVVPSPILAIKRLREAGRILEKPDDVGANDYILRPVKDLSAIAGSLGCSAILREAGNKHQSLARIEPDSYMKISRSILVSGRTNISGRVQRVGGVTGMRCALRVAFQPRLLICKLESEAVARVLGESLYKRVVAYGNARWLKNSMRIFSFSVKDVVEVQAGSITDGLKALWNAGLNDWERIKDPDGYLEEIRGDE